MSSTMETHLLLTKDGDKKLVTWRDLAIQAWGEKAKYCPFRDMVCGLCKYELCPFALFMSQ